MIRQPFIVAELSANHLGSLERAIALVETAARVGADAVKLQAWHPAHMVVDRHYVIEAGPWAGRRLAELYEEAHTPWRWFGPLFERARKLGLVGFASVFDEPSLAMLESLACPIYKIASAELTALPLIYAVGRVGKPIMISTGMGTIAEIGEAVCAARAGGCRQLTLLRCVSGYPSDPAEAGLSLLEALRHFGVAVGLSDHSPGCGIAVAATALGAEVVEKHLTISRHDGGPDAAFSLEPDEFSTLVAECRRAAAAINSGITQFGPQPSERAQALLRRSWWCLHELEAGEIVMPEHVRLARPSTGLPANVSPYGRKLLRAKHAGEALLAEDLA